ncbi:MAG: RICIN domain-containing protein, partial [Oscillospiraceae bacterium]|nr:RICIN domain-containing protein [Oscillospiraceae bacterium]
NSGNKIKYITDSDMQKYVSTKYECPFTKKIELKKAAAVMDTSAKYIFRNVDSGLYLEVENGIAENGANVQQGKSKNKAAYTWSLEEAGDGYYRIVSQIGDGKTYYLDLSYGNPENGTNIGIWTNDGTDARLFKFVDNGDGSYTITTKASSDGSCIGVNSDSTESGANVIQWQCNGNNSQKWEAVKKLELLNGVLINNLDRLDTEHADKWSISSNL